MKSTASGITYAKIKREKEKGKENKMGLLSGESTGSWKIKTIILISVILTLMFLCNYFYLGTEVDANGYYIKTSDANINTTGFHFPSYTELPRILTFDNIKNEWIRNTLLFVVGLAVIMNIYLAWSLLREWF